MARFERTARAKNQYTNYQVREKDTLMDFLQKKMPDASRGKLKILLSKRLVFVDKVIQTQFDYPLEPGMLVQISKKKGNKEFHHRELTILYEDAYIIVINKKEGLLSVNSERQKMFSAAKILNDYLKKNGGRNARVYPVHRLDRDTSGIMMFAKDEKTQHTLRDNWARIVYDRRYVAVVNGEIEKDRGEVRTWLTDHNTYVSSSPVNDGGKESITNYKTLKRGGGFSLVELKLDTGRKNQIRVHMQDLGHPIVGDGRYGIDDNNPLHRLGLHAFRLSFYHPVTREPMDFQIPYPSEFKGLFKG